MSTNQDEDHLENLEDEPLLGLQDGHDDYESTCVEENEAMESKAGTELTFLKGITLDDSPFENLEEGDPISSLEDDIGDYFHIEKDKWEIFGPQFDRAAIYDTEKEDEIGIGFSFISGTTCDDISIDTLGKENYYFPLHKEGQSLMEVIDSPFNESPIFDAYNEESNKALTYPPYDYVLESLEPLDCGEGKPVEYDTSPSSFPLPLVHDLESSSISLSSLWYNFE